MKPQADFQRSSRMALEYDRHIDLWAALRHVRETARKEPTMTRIVETEPLPEGNFWMGLAIGSTICVFLWMVLLSPFWLF